MRIKRTMVLVGSLLILGLGFTFGQEKAQEKVRSNVQTRVENRLQARWMFFDENGDGISDFARDHDNDGIPNCQDPDWTKPEDGTGYQNRYRNERQSGIGWNKASFRYNMTNMAKFCRGIRGGSGLNKNTSKRGQR
ncbi:MAG: hypothetical protein ISS41_02455 [Candidatus Aminicenantes bacterium]|nr:hypothetical protein [Candidatus Aminicenantes bacterium]